MKTILKQFLTHPGMIAAAVITAVVTVQMSEGRVDLLRIVLPVVIGVAEVAVVATNLIARRGDRNENLMRLTLGITLASMGLASAVPTRGVRWALEGVVVMGLCATLVFLGLARRGTAGMREEG